MTILVLIFKKKDLKFKGESPNLELSWLLWYS